jgi:hypothetical protein
VNGRNVCERSGEAAAVSSRDLERSSGGRPASDWLNLIAATYDTGFSGKVTLLLARLEQAVYMALAKERR